jgi:hypothetical protein
MGTLVLMCDQKCSGVLIKGDCVDERRLSLRNKAVLIEKIAFTIAFPRGRRLS